MARVRVALGISLASLASGLATLFIFRRGVPHVGWIIGYVVVLWLLFAVSGQMRGRSCAGGRDLVVRGGRLHDPDLYHGLLLFVLPGYFAATTFDGITVVFFVVLVAAGAPDHGGSRGTAPSCTRGRGSALTFFGFALFAGPERRRSRSSASRPPARSWRALVSRPSGCTPPSSARAAGGPALSRAAAAVAVLAVAVAWLARPAVPPAPVSLVRPTLARAVVDLESPSSLWRA
mgnify:CR=1 FL=1